MVDALGGLMSSGAEEAPAHMNHISSNSYLTRTASDYYDSTHSCYTEQLGRREVATREPHQWSKWDGVVLLRQPTAPMVRIPGELLHRQPSSSV